MSPKVLLIFNQNIWIYHEICKYYLINFTNIKTFSGSPIYTTNIVEGLHRQLRKVTKNKSLFPSDQALTKMIFLSYSDVAKKWCQPIKNWAYIISQFSVVFEDRIEYYLK